MKQLLVVVLSLALFCTGCSAAWVTTLDSILAAVAPTLINILQIVAIADGKTFNQALATKITNDAANIKTIAADFSKDNLGNTCQDLRAAISTYQADQALVLQVAQVSDPNTQTKITLLVGLVASTVQAITAVTPSCKVQTENGRPVMIASAPPYAVSTFVAHYNSILTAKTGNAKVDEFTGKHKIHVHSLPVRVLTLGWAK